VKTNVLGCQRLRGAAEKHGVPQRENVIYRLLLLGNNGNKDTEGGDGARRNARQTSAGPRIVAARRDRRLVLGEPARCRRPCRAVRRLSERADGLAAFGNPHTFAWVVALLAQARVQGAPLISHRFDLVDVAETIATVKAGRAIKVLVLPQRV